jgi:hypothetical protein
MWVSVDMAFKLTYTDGQESDYDDETKWALEDGGVLKLGRGEDNWSVLVSPGHWATIELGKGGKTKGGKADKDEKDDKSDSNGKAKRAKKDDKDDDDDEKDDDDS